MITNRLINPDSNEFGSALEAAAFHMPQTTMRAIRTLMEIQPKGIFAIQGKAVSWTITASETIITITNH